MIRLAPVLLMMAAVASGAVALPECLPTCPGADLEAADLSDLDLVRADFERADLTGADLRAGASINTYR